MNCMVHVFITMWWIENQPSKSTSCSDNALRLLVPGTSRLYWGLQVTASFSTWGCVLREVHFKGPYRVWRALKTSILNTRPEQSNPSSAHWLRCGRVFTSKARLVLRPALNFSRLLFDFFYHSGIYNEETTAFDTNMAWVVDSVFVFQ